MLSKQQTSQKQATPKSKYSNRLFGSVVCQGGFKEGNRDVADVKYFFKTKEYDSKISLRLASINPQNKEFERKSFRVPADSWTDMNPVRHLIEYLCKVLGFAYAKSGGNDMQYLSGYVGRTGQEAFISGFREGKRKQNV